jgi:hypothetical protein
MHKLSKRATLLISLGALAVPLGAAAVTAYACTAVATLSDSPGAAVPGSTVTVNGAFFGTHNPSDATTAGQVEIRLGSLTGPVLADATPSGTSRTFSIQVTIPSTATPGDTFLAATQLTAAGTPVFGTPARQFFTVSPPVVTVEFFAPVILAPSCVVPSVTGKSASTAERMLTSAHCAVGKVTHPAKKQKHKHLVVTSTGLSAGTTAANGTKVNLTLRWV